MRGANGSTAGARGLVPRPAAADNVKYLKGDGSWSAVTNASAATNAEAAAATSTTTFVTPANAAMAVAAQRNGLAPAQGLAFDETTGATINATIGNGDFSVFLDVNPAAISEYKWIFHGGSNAFGLFMNSGSYLIQSSLVAVGDNTASTGALTVGITSRIGYVKSGNNATYYINGVAAGTTTDSRNYSGATTSLGGTSHFFKGILRPIGIYNRALSAAEVLALYQTGAVASADYNGVLSNVNLLTAGGPWTNYSSSFNVAFASADESTVSGTSSAGIGYAYTPITLTAGSRYRVTGTATGVTGAALYVSTTTPNISGPQVGIGTIPLGTSEINLSWVETTGGSRAFVVNAISAVATSFALTNLRVWKDGLLLAPDANNAGAGLQWLDVSGNRAHIVLPTAGVKWSLPSSQQIVIEASTSTNGNQQLGGASLIDANKQWRIQSWTVNCSTGTPTISLGNVSAGTQYVSGAVMAAGNNDITLLARFPSTANLWASSTTTATLIHRIVLVPAN